MSVTSSIAPGESSGAEAAENDTLRLLLPDILPDILDKVFTERRTKKRGTPRIPVLKVAKNGS